MKKKEKLIGSIAILCIFVIFIIYGQVSKNQKVEKNISSEDIFQQLDFTEKDEAVISSKEEYKNISLEKVSNIKVQIKGEIVKPGVYTISSGSRVQDLIILAGGYTEDADKDKVNIEAKKLRDEDCIIIPKKMKEGEEANQSSIQLQAQSENNSMININTASKDELMKVPGIGETIAQSIIRYREQNGDFRKLEDLKNVDRIGNKTFEKMKDMLEVR